MAEIRRRFANKLAAKLADIEFALGDLSGAGGIEAVKVYYQRFHEMAGIAPTVGFPETGKAARALDTILVGPYRAGNALTREDLTRTDEALKALRAAAHAELQAIDVEPLT